MEPDRVSVVFHSNVLWVDAVQGIAEDLGIRLGFDDDGRFAITMALRESVNNAIIHGNRRDGSKRVEVEFCTHADRLEIVVRDQGDGFDPGHLPDPIAPQNLLNPGGRGVFLMKHYMDTVDLLGSPSSGGMIRMVKYLPDAHASGNQSHAL